MPSIQKTVLVVEDEKILRDSLKTFLSKAGFTVLEAEDGEVGLKQAFEHKPDLILLDIMMPKKDGLSVLKDLRQDPWGENVPVIMLTVLEPDDEITQKISEYKPSYYLVKANWRLEDVTSKVKEILDAS